MKISKHNKMLLFEQEFLTLLFIVLIGVAAQFLKEYAVFYLVTLAVGFALYFWMIYEERIHVTGYKHSYFEHTSSYLMVGQTAVALQLVSLLLKWEFMMWLCLIVGTIMYSVALGRILLFKMVFKEHKGE